MDQTEAAQIIEQLERQLAQRGNQLVAQDPMAQRIMGQLEVYRGLASPASENGEVAPAFEEQGQE